MNHLKELMKRGMSFRDASLMVEAIYSSAIEGANEPSTSEDYDRLIQLAR